MRHQDHPRFAGRHGHHHPGHHPHGHPHDRHEGRGHPHPGCRHAGFDGLDAAPRDREGGPGWDDPHGGRGERGGRGRRRRQFDGNELSLLVLHLTEAQPRHGYELIREIEALSGGSYAPSPGIVYPTLTMLEELGQLVAQADGAKRLFTLTDAGRAQLADNRARLEGALARLQAMRDEGSRIEGGPVWRAMQNLRAALATRLADDPARERQLDIADLIDETVRKIERL